MNHFVLPEFYLESNIENTVITKARIMVEYLVKELKKENGLLFGTVDIVMVTLRLLLILMKQQLPQKQKVMSIRRNSDHSLINYISNLPMIRTATQKNQREIIGESQFLVFEEKLDRTMGGERNPEAPLLPTHLLLMLKYMKY